MNHLVCLAVAVIKGITFISLQASVSPNPFLRPGSQQKPPIPLAPKFTPKPIPQKDMSKEIEFRGYFVLKGKPYFCLFNKKTNHAEWISLSENTYEEFQASEFDMESEVLTVLYEGSPYQLSLLQGGSSIGTTKPNSIPSIPTISNKSNASSSGTPRYMPPRPKTAPQLPDWLVKKKTPTFPLPRNSSGNQNTGFLGRVPSRTFAGGAFSNVNPLLSEPKNRTPPSSVTNNPSLPSINSSQKVNDPASSTLPIQEIETPATQSNDLDLESLPPPPPPPNIIPPSPPPDIIPRREN